MTAKDFDLQAVQQVLDEAARAAQDATREFLNKHGDRDCCGFSWVTVYDVRSNSKLGKALAEVGFKKSYTGGLQLWNPSGHSTQSITAKEEGSEAYAKVLSAKLGLKAYSGSRMD
jgi:hypothetical protein